MKQSARVICDSVMENGSRLTTIEVTQIRFCHPELLRHRVFSMSVASSRAIPYEKQRQQVIEDPMLPVLWPKQHKGMQSQEVFGPGDENGPMDANDIEVMWLAARDGAIQISSALSEQGLSKQLTNRLIEPWVATRCVITATDWMNFFMLRHPWYHARVTTCDKGHKIETCEDVTHSECPECKSTSVSVRDELVWAKEVMLHFPAEYNIQDLAIKIKTAIDASTPQALIPGAWHLPFIDMIDLQKIEDTEATELIENFKKVSAARCARTSYGNNASKSMNDDIKLADTLMRERHWSPFEHQAMATDYSDYDVDKIAEGEACICDEGLEVRIFKNKRPELWSRNFKGGWIQNRAILDQER